MNIDAMAQHNFSYSQKHLTGWRSVSVRECRTAVDWAQEVKVLFDEVYPNAKRVILVCDNLNTYTQKSLFKAFSEEEAKRMCSRLEIVHTPKHGSWLNIAEIELSVLTRQCLCRRILDIETLRRETKAWEKDEIVKETSRLVMDNG